MKKLFVFCLAVFSSVVFGQTQKAPYQDYTNFNGKNAWLFDSVLCIREFEGRKSGHIGAIKATQYIASEIKSWGLKPKGENDGYIQKFNMLVTEDITIPKMIIRNAIRGELILSEGDDFALFTNSGSADIETEVVFVGYGLSEDCWDDYKDIDVKGKIVLILPGTPEIKGCDLQEKGSRGSKYKTACDKGAAVVLITTATNRVIKGAAINRDAYNKNVPGAYLSDWVVRELFKGTGKTLEEIQQNLNKEPLSFNLKKVIYFSSQTKEIENGFGENVIGVIEGKKKKNEYIVIGAHMDHLGVSPNGLFYPGADDNGSGTALIMEMARVLSKRKDLQRSILFIAFGGEEQGLLGSNYFVEHSTIPKENIALMFNFDMVGIGDGGLRISGLETISSYWYEFYPTLNDEEKKRLQMGRGSLGGSDHTAFKLEGIPAFFIFSSGNHKYYHDYQDTYETVDPNVFQNVGSIIEKFIVFMANYNGDIIHKYRNEKNLFNSFNITDINNTVDFSFLEDKEEQKKNIIKGIQIKLFPIDANNIVEELGKYIAFSENRNDNINLIFSQIDLRQRVNSGSIKLLTLPIVKNFNGNKEIFNLLNKVKINFYDFTNKTDEVILKQIKNSCILCNPTEIDFYQKVVPPNNKFIVKGEIDELKRLEKKENVLYLVTIKDEPNIKELDDLIQRFNYKNIHLDISELLIKNENQIYEIVKQLKRIEYTDKMLSSLFGNNFIYIY